ncbi:MAG: GNAT family N-acetyltransferase [Eubacterium sp.]|nr:GNAT family N-acetyltransferase [Eubacterium sp.]
MHITETERLVIREFEENDTNDLYEMLGDRETMECLEPPYDKASTEKFLQSFCIGKKGALAAVNKDGGKVIGYLLFNCPDCPNIYELGWIINKSYWKQGYAYEACSALIGYAFDTHKADKIFAETVDAAKSVGLMKKLGMKENAEQRKTVKNAAGQSVYMYYYEITKEDYMKTRLR